VSEEQHESIARAVKACRIADLLSVIQAEEPALTAEQFAATPRGERQAYARAAGFSGCSDETWEQVVAMLADRERQAEAPLPRAVAVALERWWDKQCANAGGTMPE